ncbi:MAG: YjbH domain-containing protein [Desulfobacterales bacterium]|nr:YjbH domain-containing protein [Desulfobacterales bacterium]
MNAKIAQLRRFGCPAARVFYLALLFLMPFQGPALGWDRPFNNAANWGGTGLMEIPTARILEDGILRTGYAEARPFRWVTIGAGVFPGLEFSGRLTEITNIPAFGPNSAYGANKDKAFDLKYQLLAESKYLPAVALGLHDFHGTALFEAQYLVFSRQIFPFDFTLGLGTKRLGGAGSLSLFDDTGLFGGIEWAVHKRLHFLAEYNPIKYEQDKGSARGVPEGADSPINLGLRFKVQPGMDLGLSYQRGDTFGFMAHLQVQLGKPLLPKKPDPPLWAPVDRRPFADRDARDMVDKIKIAVEEAGFKDVTVYTDGRNLTAEFENTRYLSNQKAAGRVLRILLYHSPEDTKQLIAILKRSQMSFLKISIEPLHLDQYLQNKISHEIFAELVRVESISGTQQAHPSDLVKTARIGKFDFQPGIKPSFEPYLNDPSGFFKFRAGIEPYVTATLWKGAAAHARYKIPFTSDVRSSFTPGPDAVRSDGWLYMGTEPTLEQLLFDQTFQLPKNTLGRFSFGYLEEMYAGAGGELLKFFGDGSLALGIEGDWVRKREPGTQLALLDFEGHTLLANAYFKLRNPDLTLQAQYGRFLAGDIGWRFQVSREYEYGLVLGGWYSFTDTDGFKEAFNRGYNDKGVFISVPARMFSNYESRTRYNYAMKPWSRDVAATVDHWSSLFGLGSDLTPAAFKSNLSRIKIEKVAVIESR